MKKALLVLLVFSPWHGLLAQNLVPNPSFEDNSNGGCPTAIGQIFHAAPWQWPAVHSGQPDYFSTCGTGGTDVPSNNLGYEFPATGDAYAGLYGWSAYDNGTSNRAYLQTQLISPLVNGYLYRISFKCSYENTTVHNSYPIITDAMGVYLGNTPPAVAPNPFGPLPLVPQFQSPVEIVPTGWSEIGFDYTAAGGEQYIVLGNFKTNNTTSVTPYPDQLPTPAVQNFYFYIDDVSLVRLPYMPITGDSVICLGDTAVITASNSLTFAWATATAPNTIIGNQTSLTVTPTVTTQYLVYGDRDTASFTVTVINPTANLGNDTGICSGQTLLLDATYPNAGYLWQNQSTAPTLSASQAGTYWVQVTAAGCTGTDSVEITIMPSPSVNLGPDIQACTGNNVLLNAFGNNLSYQWNDSSTNSMYQAFQNGNYIVQVTNPYGCRDSDTVAVFFVDTLSFSFPDSTLCVGEAWRLDISSPYATYLWQDKYTGPEYIIQTDGNYWGMASNACGSHVDSMYVHFKSCDCHLYIPNSFTPDGSNSNEEFYVSPVAECDLREFSLSIYNRWGILLFQTQNIDAHWDGLNNGTPLPVGVYVYCVTYTFFEDAPSTEWGHVTLLR